jgi:hypothetical protein
VEFRVRGNSDKEGGAFLHAPSGGAISPTTDERKETNVPPVNSIKWSPQVATLLFCAAIAAISYLLINAGDKSSRFRQGLGIFLVVLVVYFGYGILLPLWELIFRIFSWPATS